jgi:hypothetical protein
MKTLVLTERLDLSEAQFDTDARVLQNVVLIRAGLSANRRRYTEAVLQAAVPVFEGAKAYDSHSRNERKVSDITGWYANVRYADGKLIADRYFSRTDAGRNVMSIAEDIISGNAPKTLAGLSINAVGKGKTVKSDDGSGDVLEVEAISAANSVDDVTEPAAGGGYSLTASMTGDSLTTDILAALEYDEWYEARPEYTARLQKEWATVRQDNAVKAAQAEADRAKLALKEAQEGIKRAEADREAARLETAQARRDLALAETLATVKLPSVWKTDLRERLGKAEPGDWAAIIESEQRKAETAGHKPQISVRGAAVQVASTPVILEDASPLPRPNENVDDWQQRIARINGRK